MLKCCLNVRGELGRGLFVCIIKKICLAFIVLDNRKKHNNRRKQQHGTTTKENEKTS